MQNRRRNGDLVCAAFIFIFTLTKVVAADTTIAAEMCHVLQRCRRRQGNRYLLLLTLRNILSEKTPRRAPVHTSVEQTTRRSRIVINAH